MTSACTPKQEKIVGIDVLLTLPKEMHEQAVKLNQAIVKENQNNFSFDDTHVPHITLLQGYISEKDLSTIQQKLKGLYQTIENNTLRAEGLQYSRENAESFSSIGIAKSEWLVALHKKTIALLEPYLVKNGSEASFVPNENGKPIDQFTMEYVPNFINDHSYEHYNPHISLGVAKTVLLDSLNQNFTPIQFNATSVSLYQLGDFGTARKMLWQSE